MYAQFKANSASRSHGVFRIANELRSHGYKCQVIDYFFSFTEEEIDQVCKKFISKNTAIVAFSSTFWFKHTYFPNNNDFFKQKISQVIDYVRTNYPNTKIICGGTQSINLSKMFNFDSVFHGYSDKSIIDYVKTIKDQIFIYDPKVDNFDFTKSQTLYRPEDLIDSDSTLVLEIARGCIFKCKFCAFPLNGKKKLDFIKDPDILRDELIQNYDKWGVNTYIISDDTFNDSTDKLRIIHKVFTQLPFKIRFTCYLRLDLLNAFPEQISLLKEMGIAGTFCGLETLNHKTAKAIGKGIVPDVSKSILKDLKLKYWGNDVNITLGIITGLPYETYQSIDQMIDWINDVDNCLVDSIRPIQLLLYKPEENIWTSEFERNAKDYGYTILENGHWSNNLFEIKSSIEAERLAIKVRDALVKRDLEAINSNFNVFYLNNIGKYSNVPKTFDEIIKMSNKERKNWIIENNGPATEKLLHNYKNNLLNL